MVIWAQEHREAIALGFGVFVGAIAVQIDSALLALVFLLMVGLAFGALGALRDRR